MFILSNQKKILSDFYSSVGDKGDAGSGGPAGLKGKPGETILQHADTDMWWAELCLTDKTAIQIQQEHSGAVVLDIKTNKQGAALTIVQSTRHNVWLWQVQEGGGTAGHQRRQA